MPGTGLSKAVHQAHKWPATTSYMVTFEGATQFSYQFSSKQQIAPVDVGFFKALHRRDLNDPIVVTPLVKQWNTGNVANDSNIEDPNREDGTAGSRPRIVYSMQASLHYDDFNKARVDWIGRTDMTG